MKKIAFIFPGQGSQYVGMGKDIYESEEIAAEVFEKANEVLNFSLSNLCFRGPEEELTLTANVQPAILTVSYALLKLIERKGIEASLVAGHSLGEYTALVCSGSITFEEALKIVRKRGQYMQEAVPFGQGAMAAIIGLSPNKVEEICKKVANNKVVEPANYNSQDQVVISGEKNAVEEASELARQEGAKRIIPLKVSAPFHCSLMKPAEVKLKNDLERLVFNDLKIPLVNNVDAQIIFKGIEAKNYLIRQITSPVRWYHIILKMLQEGVDTFIEIGPGKVLSGLIKRIESNCNVFNVQDLKTLEEVFLQII